MISPHGGTLINRIVEAKERERLLARVGSMPKLHLDAWMVSDVEMIAIGALSPLEGFMTRRDYDAVVKDCRLSNGLIFPIPVTLAVDRQTATALNPGTDVALAHDGQIVAILHLEDRYEPDKALEANQVFRTNDPAHPGVRRLAASGGVYLGGKLSVANRPRHTRFVQYRLDPEQTRRIFAERGWKRIVGFQTRNPIHRAHEHVQKTALEVCDGLLLHPIVGETKDDDVAADVRMRSYEVLLERYYPKDRVVLAVNPASMRYAGPREAIFHALIRKNYGCTHFIVGRDHAGVGNFYGPYDAQKAFEEFEPQELGITPLLFENAFYCTACGGMASTKTCPHKESERVSLSGTKVRELLAAGQLPPREVSRPEVAQVLLEAMRNQSTVHSP